MSASTSNQDSEAQYAATETPSRYAVLAQLPDFSKLRRDFHFGDVDARAMKRPGETGSRADYQAFSRIFTHESVFPSLAGTGSEFDVESLEGEAEDRASDFGESSAIYLMTVKKKKGTRKAIGFGGSEDSVGHDGWPTITFAMDPDHSGQGICTDFVKTYTSKLMELASRERPQRITVSSHTLYPEEISAIQKSKKPIQVPFRVLAYTFPNNDPGKRVLTKCRYRERCTAVFSVDGTTGVETCFIRKV